MLRKGHGDLYKAPKKEERRKQAAKCIQYKLACIDIAYYYHYYYFGIFQISLLVSSNVSP